MNFTVPKIDGFIKNPKTLGDHIRNRRLKLHLFQKDVADLFEVSTESITNWENNHSVPQIQFYKKIIDFLEFFPFDIDTSTLQGKMKEYRYRNGLSYKEFAKLFGVNQTTILDWEENRIRINSKYIDDLKKIINIKNNHIPNLDI